MSSRLLLVEVTWWTTGEVRLDVLKLLEWTYSGQLHSRHSRILGDVSLGSGIKSNMGGETDPSRETSQLRCKAVHKQAASSSAHEILRRSPYAPLPSALIGDVRVGAPLARVALMPRSFSTNKQDGISPELAEARRTRLTFQVPGAVKDVQILGKERRYVQTLGR